MPKTLEDWQDAFYEQQARYTEAYGMHGAELRAVQAKVEALRFVVEKAAEWDPENTDNADLAALGAYARAALSDELPKSNCRNNPTT